MGKSTLFAFQGLVPENSGSFFSHTLYGLFRTYIVQIEKLKFTRKKNYPRSGTLLVHLFLSREDIDHTCIGPFLFL